MLTALGVGGLAISLALKDTLSDLFAGLHILLSRKVVPGDLVELDTLHKGTVQNITWRNTIIQESPKQYSCDPQRQTFYSNYDQL